MRRLWSRVLGWTRRHVPPGLRTVLGILLLLGGLLGFLPVLGFWMIPLGLAVIALDVRKLRKKLRRQRRSGTHGSEAAGKRDRDE